MGQQTERKIQLQANINPYPVNVENLVSF